VRLTGGGAREQCGLLQETLQEEVKARNEPIQREYERALRTYEGELAVYDALTAEQQADVDQPEPPEEPVLSNSFIQPVVRFWNLLENLYPERSTARITEFREFQMKPGESMANMVSRLQTLKLVLRQPEPTSVFKFLDAIRPKMLADKVKDILRVKEMDPVDSEDCRRYSHQIREVARRRNLVDNQQECCGSFYNVQWYCCQDSSIYYVF